MIRHALGVLGVLAAGVLLAVSAAMNWRFGFSLGRSELDGQIYGAASAAADCFKALIPFFFFAAIKNRMWSQAAASAVVWVVVTAYSLTSALGHAALNRLDTAGQRTVQAQSYQDLRAGLKHAQDELGWIPQHRPAQTVQADIDALKSQRAFVWTKGCTEVKGKDGREFCGPFHELSAELAAAQQAVVVEAKIAEYQNKIAKSSGGSVLTQADPQAAVLAKLLELVFPNVKVEDVQTALTIFVALLLEIGSGLGMYVAFSQWRLYETQAPSAPSMASINTTAAVVAAVPAVQTTKPRSGANDNVTKVAAVVAPTPRLVAPENDVERYYKERIESKDGSTVTATEMYEDYCAWCESKQKEPLALPTFGRQFGDLGIQKSRIAGRTRYIGIALNSGVDLEEDKKLTALGSKAA